MLLQAKAHLLEPPFYRYNIRVNTLPDALLQGMPPVKWSPLAVAGGVAVTRYFFVATLQHGRSDASFAWLSSVAVDRNHSRRMIISRGC